MKKRLHLVRHGESESNAGGRTTAHHETRITERGQAQAERLTETWSLGDPSLIVTSPFVRTKLTAASFVKRYAHVPQTQWNVQEFTQIDPKNWHGTTHEERMPKIREYWEESRPNYRDGPDAESFVMFFTRVRWMFERALEHTERNIVIFTHATFMQAAIWTILVEPFPETHDDMRRFYRFSEVVNIDNTATLSFTWHGKHWAVGPVRNPG